MADIPADELYLGGELDATTKERSGNLTTYDPDDLVTHGVIVGMTGSGKTGLAMVLIEEVLRHGVPALLIDPKGDLTNIALQFPDLAPADYLPWVDVQEASKAGQTPQQAAEATSTLWREGLAGWGLSGNDIAALKNQTRFTIYTPGSNSGVPLNLIGSLKAPSGGDLEAAQDEIEGFVSGLLAMAGIDADPLTSPEHILLANLIQHAWSKGRDLDLAQLLALVQDPPMRKLGVIDLDTFFPPKDRMGLVIRLNGLLASPAFQAWAQGPPLDLASMLWDPAGRPSAAVISLGHLSDEERQFVVTLLFSKLITWMRAQPGTASLRVLAYMDEVFGYVPPNGAPPAKKPILTVLKQGRAFGVGLVLATQNPVDIDYKAISNAGTWMIGRLQTERDKNRLLEGLSSAAGGVDTGALADVIAGLGKRQFVLHRAGASAPKLFTTRWALSYLRGPLTRDQLALLTANAPERALEAPAATTNAAQGSGSAAAESSALRDDESPIAPPLAEGTQMFFVDPAAPWAAALGAVSGGTTQVAALAARVQLLYDDAKADLRELDEWEAVLTPLAGPAQWERAAQVDYDDRDLRAEAPANAVYRLPEAPIAKAAFFRDASKSLVTFLKTNQQLELLRNVELKLTQRPSEASEAFAARCQLAAEERSDQEASLLRDKLTEQAERIRAAMAQAEARVEDLKSHQQRKQAGSLLRAAGGLLSSFLGGRKSSRALARSIGSAAGTMVGGGSASLDSAERAVAEKRSDLDRIEGELATQLVSLDEKWDTVARNVQAIQVGLEASDVTVSQLALVWLPTNG